MLVVFGELEVPIQLSSVCIQGEQGIAVEIVTGASLTAIRGRGISGGPENLICDGIKSTRVPGGSAAVLPGIAFPTIMAGLSRTGYGIEAPLALASRGIIGVNKSADAVFPA